MKHKGFSLIELLVVVAIIAVLAAIAVPLYQQYSIRSKIARTISLVQSYAAKAQLYYSTHGLIPTNAQLEPLGQANNSNGFVISNGYSGNGPWQAGIANAYLIQDLYYTMCSSYTTSATPAFVFSVGMAAGATGNSAVDGSEYMYLVIPQQNGTFQVYCGPWDNNYSGYHRIPPQYLPGGCQTLNVSSFWPAGC